PCQFLMLLALLQLLEHLLCIGVQSVLEVLRTVAGEQYLSTCIKQREGIVAQFLEHSIEGGHFSFSQLLKTVFLAHNSGRWKLGNLAIKFHSGEFSLAAIAPASECGQRRPEFGVQIDVQLIDGAAVVA